MNYDQTVQSDDHSVSESIVGPLLTSVDTLEGYDTNFVVHYVH